MLALGTDPLAARAAARDAERLAANAPNETFRVLAESYESVVSDERLIERGWPAAHASANALRVHLHRLRRRIHPLGLEVRVVRREGWVLQAVG